jgi:predicted alpha/beta-fold hydrolase
MIPYSFRPALPLRNAHVQTLLSSSKARTWGENPMVASSREMIITTDDGVRLLGAYSPQPQEPAKGLVILLHGWEGSIDSTYILRTGRHLFKNGYAIFRLNFRDHGQSHHLNSDIFYATLLNEVFQAINQVAESVTDTAVFIVGFSLGGNFALRIARKCSQELIDNFRHIVAVSPVLDPNKATDKIDGCRYILKYFLKKWRRSLLKKETLFPHLYDFSNLYDLNSIRKMTDILVERHSDLKSTSDYFKGYTIASADLKSISVPTTLLIAEDDPIIPIEDFHQLQLNDNTNLVIQRYGGHNGFISGIFLKSWYENAIVGLFDVVARPIQS